MNTLILGATGPTGKILVDQALRQGHTVTALVRDPSKLTIQNEHLRIHSVNILNEPELTNELLNQNAVLSALGSGRDLHSDIISRTMPVLIASMQRAQVKRVVFLSSFGVGKTKDQASFFSRFFFRILLKDILADKFIADELLKRSELEYTLVYPTRLTNGPREGRYRVGEKIPLPFFPRISRADVAAFMLTLLTDMNWIRKTVIISN